jgi:hypothetical protein
MEGKKLQKMGELLFILVVFSFESLAIFFLIALFLNLH